MAEYCMNCAYCVKAGSSTYKCYKAYGKRYGSGNYINKYDEVDNCGYFVILKTRCDRGPAEEEKYRSYKPCKYFDKEANTCKKPSGRFYGGQYYGNALEGRLGYGYCYESESSGFFGWLFGY